MSFGNSSDFLFNFSVGNMNGDEKHFYQFKSFRLDVAERQLLNNGMALPLMPKVFDVLVLLVERHGHLVEKDELLRIVWADSFVEEANIARIVHTLRKVLGEDENGNKFIETVAKKGYRFVAKVDEVSQPIAIKPQIQPSVTDETLELSVTKPKHNKRVILFAIGFLSAIFLIYWLGFNRQSTSFVSSNTPKSIAILPIKPVNIDNRDLIYELGIAESLIYKFNSVKGLTIRPLSATRKYSDIEQDALVAGREQKVDYVIASNYQIADGKILVTSQLINVQTGETEETLRSEKVVTNKFSMQDAIANDFGNTLLTRLGRTTNNQQTKHETTSEEAYRLYQRGMILNEKWSADDAHKAAELFEQAIKLDPNYAQAYVGLASAHHNISIFGGKPHDEYPISKNALERALQLDENSAEAYAVLGDLQITYEYNQIEAEKSFRHSIELNPNFATARRLFALFLMSIGRFDEAIAEAKTGIDLDPNMIMGYHVLGLALFLTRRYDDAIVQFNQVIEMNPSNNFTYSSLSDSYHWKGDYDRAFKYFLLAETQYGANVEAINSWETVYAKSGWQGVLRGQLERWKQMEIKGDTSFMEIASLSAQLGDKEQAFAYLEKSYQKRELFMTWILVEPRLDSLHSDPRFVEIVKRVGLQ
jgi:DNA-binding winged helix-turn-helix (wHTH) protein/tetratricopeptide (TPR) repeat protein